TSSPPGRSSKGCRSGTRFPEPPNCWSLSASNERRCRDSRTNSPAASVSESALHARLPSSLSCWWRTNRRRLSLAMLLITHDLRVAAQVCDRIAVMHRGKVVEYGATVDLFTRPQHAYTQQLIGSIPGRDWLEAEAGPPAARPAASGSKPTART